MPPSSQDPCMPRAARCAPFPLPPSGHFIPPADPSGLAQFDAMHDPDGWTCTALPCTRVLPHLGRPFTAPRTLYCCTASPWQALYCPTLYCCTASSWQALHRATLYRCTASSWQAPHRATLYRCTPSPRPAMQHPNLSVLLHALTLVGRPCSSPPRVQGQKGMFARHGSIYIWWDARRGVCRDSRIHGILPSSSSPKPVLASSWGRSLLTPAWGISPLSIPLAMGEGRGCDSAFQ